jgi:16S rRNA processing protein RimM
LDISSLVIIGTILKVSGLKGSLKIKVLTDFPERFEHINKVYLVKGNKLFTNKYNNSHIFNIENLSLNKNQLKLKFLLYDNIDDASELKDCSICIELKDRVKLEKDNYYYDELINMNVFSGSQYLGKVKKVENYGSDDLLLVGNKDEKEFYIPMRKQFIKNIDLNKNEISVTLIDGLI